jgi:hypothetical protein
MAYGVTTKGQKSRLVLNQKKFTELDRVFADGIFALAKEIIVTAAPLAPDSPLEPYPTGEGLPKQGGVLVYLANLKTHGWSLRGDQPVKPSRSSASDIRRDSTRAARSIRPRVRSSAPLAMPLRRMPRRSSAPSRFPRLRGTDAGRSATRSAGHAHPHDP